MYDSKKRSGVIYEKLKYEKRIQRKRNRDILGTVSVPVTASETETVVDSEMTHELEAEIQPSPEIELEISDTKELTEFFQEIVLPRDEKKMKNKLANTVQVRRDSDFNNSRTLFNHFLVLPSLVIIFRFKLFDD